MKKLLAKVFTKEWLVAAGIRALKTVAQAALAAMGTSYVLEEVDWKLVISIACMAGILSLLTSIAGLPELELKDSMPEITIPEEEGTFAEITFESKEDNE